MRALRLEPGATYGKLTFVRDTGGNRNGNRVGLFSCDCGREHHACVNEVTRGHTRSCGCTHHAPITHGLSKSTEFRTWASIVQRCENSNNKSYNNYGGRGITFWPEWRASFSVYHAYVAANLGPRPPGMTLDRIDNDKGYEPGNVRWATRSVQNSNRRPRK